MSEYKFPRSPRCHQRTVKGWRCTRSGHSTGPCAAVPRWWNIKARLRIG